MLSEIVAALIYLLGFTPTAAGTASLIIVAATSATALSAHARAGNVRWRTGILFASAGLVPALLGSVLARHLPASLLTGAFALTAALVALRMLRPSGYGPDDPPVRPVQAAGAGAGLGAVTGVLGVGGGFLAVPALVNVLGLRMRAAVGTSLLVITLNSLAALLARAGSAETLNWATLGSFAGAAVLGAWDGKRLAEKVSAGTLRRIFACVLLTVAAFMLIDLLIV
ncbi:sulfite exporter TauE/SafE family protein [Streptomyces mirabilis]|uniref:sulfite exporter TauE/SafE family protein n=1 Tax=Streptomyces mirabilis TaxID=68239 RepID=UPI0033BD2B61